MSIEKEKKLYIRGEKGRDEFPKRTTLGRRGRRRRYLITAELAGLSVK